MGSGLKYSRWAIWLILAFLLPACRADANSARPTATPGARGLVQTAQVTSGATGTALLPGTAAGVEAPAGEYTNPVLDRDFPDPDVLRVGDTYYVFATNAGDVHIQTARSADLVHWELLGDALPGLPSWAAPDAGLTWAPDVYPSRLSPQSQSGGPYVMYFTTRFAIGRTGSQCIGLATGEQPQGPFISPGSDPFICFIGQGGALDADTFVDEDGQRYLVWKADGIGSTPGVGIYIQPLSPDGLKLQGEPHLLITMDQTWEGALIEGPTLWKQGGKYYLFYSGNDTNTPRYAVGYATADDPLGPYTKAAGPILKTDLKAGIVGPGGQNIVLTPSGETWMLFHAWSPAGYRALNLARLEWQNDAPVVTGLSRAPQPAPK